MTEELRELVSRPSTLYLGDAVYVAVGAYLGEVILFTADGIQVRSRITLDPNVARSLVNWLEKRERA